MKTSEMSKLDIIMSLEGGRLEINDIDDWNYVKSIVWELSYCQGFYSRLRSDMSEIENSIDFKLEFPLYM